MGEVYRAEDSQLKRTVALKRVSPGAPSTVPYKNMLLREAQRASALNHPRIASVYDVLVEKDELFVVMEFVDGCTLRDRMDSAIDIREFYDIATQCLEG